MAEPSASLPAAPSALGRRLRSKLGIAISVVAVAGCVWWASDQQAPQIPTSGRALGLLAAGLAAYALSMAVRGFRWSVILARAGIVTDRLEPYALTLVGYMGNTVLPLRGGEALRVVLLRERAGCGWAAAVGSIVPERLLDLGTLILLLLAMVLTGTVLTPGTEAIALIGTGALAAAPAGVLVYRRLRAAGKLESLADRIRPFAHASRLLLRPAGAWLGLVSVLIWSLDGTVFWLVAQALDLPIGLGQAVGLAVVVTVFSAIPAGPAYAGTYDVALLVSLKALEITGGIAISYVLLVRFLIFVPVTIAGLLIAVTRYGGLGRLRRRAVSERELDRGAASGAGTIG